MSQFAAGLTISGKLVGTSDLEKPQSALSISGVGVTLTAGTGNNQFNQLWSDSRSIGTGGESLDLSGSLTNALGATVNFTAVKTIYIRNKATSGNLIVGNAASNGFISWVGALAHTITIPPGGVFMLTAPLAGFGVTGGTADLLKIAASAGTIDYDIVLAGVA